MRKHPTGALQAVLTRCTGAPTPFTLPIREPSVLPTMPLTWDAPNWESNDL